MEATPLAQAPPILVRPSRDSDIDAMLAIYRRHIRGGVEPDVIDVGAPEPDDLRDRRKNMRNRRLPHVVATSGDVVVGYAYAVLFRKRPAYRYTAKHSIYVHHEHLGRGIGGVLLRALIDACAAAGFRQMIGYIDADNAASLALHQRFGFTKVAHLPAVAWRYGGWSDSVMMQRVLGPEIHQRAPALRQPLTAPMRVDLFDFDLPEELIAQRPVSPRDSARLLDVAPDGLSDRTVRNLPQLLKRGDLLVFNDTKVIPARLKGTRRGGQGRQDVAVEALLIRDLGAGHWLCFARPVKRLKLGDVLAFPSDLGATVDTIAADGSIVLAFGRSGTDFLAALESRGAVPLPPYIRGGVADGRDRADYQTLFARVDGSVAAPTAGLHFTPALMAALADAGVTTASVTLHVGAGTFQPVRVDDTDQHAMHSEWGEVPAATAQAIEQTRRDGGRVVSIGTTALRLLESVARAHDGAMRGWSGETDIFITPGFHFRAIDLLLTNFHLPRSTLFMLVSAFAGVERMREAYAHAVAGRYRFYSYGDCCLLHR